MFLSFQHTCLHATHPLHVCVRGYTFVVCTSAAVVCGASTPRTSCAQPPNIARCCERRRAVSGEMADWLQLLRARHGRGPPMVK